MSETSARIQVVVRIRPFTTAEVAIGEANVIKILNSTTCISSAQQFSFDRVFAPHDNQETVFEQFKESVDHALDGFNSSIIAYGQTAAGKSFTMTGFNEERRKGIIPRAITRVFANTSQSVRATFVELYNDKLRDLFSNLDGVTMQGDGTLKNALVIDTASKTQLMNAITHANSLRAVASTKMNNQSSRSHAVLQLQLGSHHNNAKLVLVDLAGSEKASKTGNTGVKLGEAGNINKSLTVLAMVIQALSSRMPHVPYRDSKLTQILRDSIGGNSRTVLIVNCSPSGTHERESLSSLRFGTRAKMVENKLQSQKELDTLAKVHHWQQMLHSELQQWELFGNIAEDALVGLAEVESIEGFFSPKVADPFATLITEINHKEPVCDCELEHLKSRVQELEDRITSIDKKAAEFERSFVKRTFDEADGAAQLLRMQFERVTKAIYSCREENLIILGKLAAARVLTFEQKSQKYLVKINEASDRYARLLAGNTLNRSRQAVKRPSSSQLPIIAKLRRTSTTSYNTTAIL